MKGFGLLVIVLLTSCAASYTPIEYGSVRYTKSSSNSSVYSTEYGYDILTRAGNKRYAKKEDKTDISLVAIKFTNNSENVIKGSDLKFFTGEQEFTPVDNETIYKKLKQGSVGYLLYLPLVMTKTECGKTPYSGCETSILFPIGIPLSLLNIIISSSSNSSFKKQLEEGDLSRKFITPGETVNGIIGVRNPNYGVINLFPAE